MIQSIKVIETVIFDIKECHNIKRGLGVGVGVRVEPKKFHVFFEWPLMHHSSLPDVERKRV